MAGRRQLTVLCTLLTLCVASQTFDHLLSDVTPCEEACTKSSPPDTSPGAGDNIACNRGCRFYTINEFIIKDPTGKQDDLSASLLSDCYQACVEAYNETSSSTAACKRGCDAQKTLSQNKKTSDTEQQPSSLHLLGPIMQVRSVYSSFVGAFHIVRSSLVTFFISSDNSIVAVESEPQVMMELVPKEEQEVEGDTAALGGLPHSRNLPYEESEGDGSVVKCFSRRLGMPPYLLVASVLGLVLFTFYVMFAVCNTASPPKAKTEGLSVQADPLPLPIKLVRPEELTKLSLMEEDDLQAAPLPSKVRLPDSTI